MMILFSSPRQGADQGVDHDLHALHLRHRPGHRDRDGHVDDRDDEQL